MPSMKAVNSPKVALPPPNTWSNCKLYGNQFFISGMTARNAQNDIDGKGSMYEQSKVVFTKIKNLVEAAGGKMNDVIKVNIYVTNIRQREEVWKARAEFFTGEFPCSTLVQVAALATPETWVEIEAVGFIGGGA